MRICVDLTEFLSSPHRTGIQRVTGELCGAWPAGLPLTPVRLAPGKGLVLLPVETLGVIRDYFQSAASEPEVKARLAALCQAADAAGEVLELTPDDRLLVPEVFFDPVRITFYRQLSAAQLARVFFVVFDLLPLTHPQHFAADIPHHVISDYFRLIRDATHLSFISAQTRNAFYTRLRRAAGTGPVLRLGSDGLGARGSAAGGADPLFVMVGTIEPRKNHQFALDVFEGLFPIVPELRLAFLGRIGWVDARFASRVRHLAAGCPQFSLIENPDDGTIRGYVERARATLFLSTAEGFGLPPVESLWLGTPVVAPACVPSLEEIGDRGVFRVDPADRALMRRAIVSLLDEGIGRRKREEARQLDLPTWAGFAAQAAEWVGTPGAG